MIPSKEIRCGQPLPSALFRIGLGAVRRRVLRNYRAVVPIDGHGVRIEAQLDTNQGLHIYRHGWCELAGRAVARLVKPGDVVIDGGANLGIYTLVAAAAAGPSGAVHAFEPAPGTAAILRRNIEINDFGNITVHEAALADVDGELEFTVFEPGSAMSSFAPADEGTKVKVRSTTIDSAAAGLGRVALIKLDLEGAEVKALQGARSVLQEHRPTLILEVEGDHLVRQDATVEDLAAELEGYQAHSIAHDGSLEPIAWPWRPPKREPNVVFTPVG